jgi:catechol 2,3-dioxygenase-like lactoylglutathione lyase family enzyme
MWYTHAGCNAETLAGVSWVSGEYRDAPASRLAVGQSSAGAAIADEAATHIDHAITVRTEPARRPIPRPQEACILLPFTNSPEGSKLGCSILLCSSASPRSHLYRGVVKYFVVHYTMCNGASMTRLAHVNIRTAHLERSVAFYADVLGLTAGPAATRRGSPDHVWMSDDEGNACIHLQRANASALEEAEQAGVHHVALACENASFWRDKLDLMGVEYQERKFAAAQLIQFNLRDPNGVRLELLFELQ